MCLVVVDGCKCERLEAVGLPTCMCLVAVDGCRCERLEASKRRSFTVFLFEKPST
jgi:hypothetical protein